MMSRKKITYHHRIISALLLLSVVFYIPYMITMYIATTSEIKETIETSNEEHLNQIYREFENDKKTLSQQVYSIYVGSTMQPLLYSNDIGFDAISELQSINTNIVSVNPSIYSVAFYNAGLKEFHSTISPAKDDSLTFVSQQSSPGKMTPIFRKMNLPYTNDEDLYLLSYLMYEYRMTQGNPSSFVIINQNVEYLLNELRASTYVENTHADIFLLSGDYGICGEVRNIAEKNMAEFTAEFAEKKAKGAQGGDAFTIRTDGKEFLVSYVTLTNANVDVVIIQPKNVVFSPLTELHIRFFILLVIGLAAYLVVVYFLSKSLYRPVETLGNHIRELEGSGSFNKETNEFEQFKAVYSSFTTMKQKYYLRYMEDQLLTSGGEAAASSFAASFPNHWLLKKPQFLVAQIVVDFPMEPASSQENALDLYAVQNISEELLSGSFVLETLQMDSNHLAIILGSDGNWSSLFSKFSKVKKSIDHFFDFSISVYCSDSVTSLDNLNDAYQQTCTLETYAPMFGKNKILSSDAIVENLNNPAISYSQPLLNELTTALTSRNGEKIHTALQSLCAETKKLSMQNLWFCISLLINHIRNVLRELSASTTVQSSGFMKQLTQIMNEFTTVDTFFGKLEKLVVSVVCADGQGVESGDKNTVFLRNIEAYINENYQDSQLSPQQIAERFNVSANYLPRKFQLLSGMSLNNYILQVRMSHAQKLLMGSDLPISEIAISVGIENESYFYKLFKKYYGCTPKEYKNRQV